MKKTLLLLSILSSLSIFATDIVIFDFESDFAGKWGTNGNPTNNATNEDHVNFSIVDNPVATGINTSARVGKFHRLKTGLWWAYAWFEFTPVYIEATINQPKYVHVSINKPITSRVCMQMRTSNGSGTNTGEILNDKQTTVNGWQELVFKITTTGTYGYIAIKPDFVNATVSTRLSEDIDIYIDNIYINDDPSVLGESGIAPFAGNIPEDFEGVSTLLNPTDYAGDRFGSFIQTFATTDVVLVENPLKEGNLSDKCGKFVRKKDGPWNAGFYMIPISTMTVDATNKYFHIMVYKTMESPINLKLENGAPVANTGDIVVTPTSADINKWTDYVIEIPSAKYSVYGKISLFLDFLQTPAPSERFAVDQDIYFDNIEINSSPDLRIGGIGTKTLNERESATIEAKSDMNGNICITNNGASDCLLQIYNITGKLLKTTSLLRGINTIDMNGQHGVFLLKTDNCNFKIIL